MRHFALLPLCLSLLCLSPAQANAATISQEKKAEIKEMLKATDNKRLAIIVAKEMMPSTIKLLKKSNPEITDKMIKIIEKETFNTFIEEMNKEEFYEIYYPLYDKHFTLEELKMINDFYQTPTGKKVMRTMPNLMQESINISREWGASLEDKLNKRIEESLRENLTEQDIEDYIKAKEAAQ